jgi:hypothetical protein
MQPEGSSPSSQMLTRYVMCYEMQMVLFCVVDLCSVSAVLKRLGRTYFLQLSQKIKAACSSETMEYSYSSAPCNDSDDHNIRAHSLGTPKSYIAI